MWASVVAMRAVLTVNRITSPRQQIPATQAVHASADSLSADQLVADPTLAPPLRVAVTQGSESSSGLPMAMVIGSGSSTLYPFSSEHSFRHKKGADLPQRLVNAQLLLQLCHAGDGAVLASTPLDLLPLALGASQLQDQLPLVPAEPVGSQMFRVRLLHALQGRLRHVVCVHMATGQRKQRHLAEAASVPCSLADHPAHAYQPCCCMRRCCQAPTYKSLCSCCTTQRLQLAPAILPRSSTVLCLLKRQRAAMCCS